MIKYRPHRHLLADSMHEMREVDSFAELVRCMRSEVQSWYPADQLPTEDNTAVKPYCRDDRIGWDTYIVTVNGQAWGFTDGPCERQDDTHLTSTIASMKAKIAAAKNGGDPLGEAVVLTLAELIVIEDGLDMLRKIIPEKTSK